MRTGERDSTIEPTEQRRPGHPERDGLADVIAFPTLGRRTASNDAPDPKLRQVVGTVLRDERHSQNRTLADVAAAAAVSLAYLSEVERGRKEISSDLLDAVGAALELPLVEILERCVERLRMQGTASFQLRAA
jgi:hypothetical protein